MITYRKYRYGYATHCGYCTEGAIFVINNTPREIYCCANHLNLLLFQEELDS